MVSVSTVFLSWFNHFITWAGYSLPLGLNFIVYKMNMKILMWLWRIQVAEGSKQHCVLAGRTFPVNTGTCMFSDLVDFLITYCFA